MNASDADGSGTGDFRHSRPSAPTANLQNGKRRSVATKKAGKYVIARTQSAGVFAGNLESRVGQEAVLTNARRLWYWAGAASLSQMAVSGTSKPKDCKFPVAVPRVELLQVIEILDVTPEGESSIKAVPVWETK
jgi:uncharacterized protein DUF6948